MFFVIGMLSFVFTLGCIALYSGIRYDQEAACGFGAILCAVTGTFLFLIIKEEMTISYKVHSNKVHYVYNNGKTVIYQDSSKNIFQSNKIEYFIDTNNVCVKVTEKYDRDSLVSTSFTDSLERCTK